MIIIYIGRSSILDVPGGGAYIVIGESRLTAVSKSAILKQGYTAVLPDYRGNGIGRRLKAEMIRRIRETIPEEKVVRTGNDNRRKAMLRINSQLGFRHHMTQYGWELEVETLRSYLTGS